MRSYLLGGQVFLLWGLLPQLKDLYRFHYFLRRSIPGPGCMALQILTSSLILMSLPSHRISSYEAVTPPCLLTGCGPRWICLELLKLLRLVGLAVGLLDCLVHPVVPVLEIVGPLALECRLP